VNVVFYIAAAVAVISTAMVLTRPHAVHALLYLIVSLLAVAVVFFVLGATFVAALEVIVYAGAIMVLFLFVVMLLNQGPETMSVSREWLNPAAWVGPAVLAVILLALLLYLLAAGGMATIGVQSAVPPQAVGASLFGAYLVAVELASMLLLAALVGAYHLGRRRD
jgi:NADH-quinone oxidoreductase subunit J